MKSGSITPPLLFTEARPASTMPPENCSVDPWPMVSTPEPPPETPTFSTPVLPICSVLPAPSTSTLPEDAALRLPTVSDPALTVAPPRMESSPADWSPSVRLPVRVSDEAVPVTAMMPLPVDWAAASRLAADTAPPEEMFSEPDAALPTISAPAICQSELAPVTLAEEPPAVD